MLNKGGNLIAGKQFTDLTKASALKDTNIIAVHDGNGLKKASMEDVTMYMADKFSNPNLLINPDFKINQRGNSTYSSTGSGATVDRWIGANAKTVVNSDNTVSVTPLNGEGYYVQHEENISYGKHTYSIYIQTILGTVKAYYRNKDSRDVELGTLKQGLNTFTSSDDGFKSLLLIITGGSSVTLKYAKVEQGTVATPFIAPNYAEELSKCRRYYTIIGNTLIGYVMSSVSFYMGFTEPLSIRIGGTIVINGNNESNYLRCDGKATKVNIDVSKSTYEPKYIRLQLAGNSTSEYDSRVCALDCSSAIIAIDAEIY